MTFAAVSAEEANKLKNELTPLGAERAGSKDGTIPAWNGGYTTVPAGYVSGNVRPDPFANEKPLFSITAKNMNQYDAKLTEGTKQLLKRYPDYRIDVYPTHRTAAVPQYVYDNTFKNATRAKTKDNGLSVEGAYGGVPFPIPKTGNEVMWNHLLSFRGESVDFNASSWLIDASGKRVMASAGYASFQYPYFYKNTPIEKHNGYYYYNLSITTAPPYQVGGSILAKYPLDMYGVGQQVWQYLVGQRRVRRSPSLAYDTPNFIMSGFSNFDEGFLFNGALDRYTWKIVGKKEMYIPYNCNRFLHGKLDQVLTKMGPNPDWMRWELHRVWVIEARLAPGKRHAAPHRIFYLDEDTWAGVLNDNWDASGRLWRTTMAIPLLLMEYPAVYGASQMTWDLLKGTCLADTMLNEQKAQWKSVAPKRETYFTPDNLAVIGSR